MTEKRIYFEACKRQSSDWLRFVLANPSKELRARPICIRLIRLALRKRGEVA